jgi:hypothetical protein
MSHAASQGAAAVRYMEGAPTWPWWKYTADRKKKMAALASAQ